jgi:hypothetical protein
MIPASLYVPIAGASPDLLFFKRLFSVGSGKRASPWHIMHSDDDVIINAGAIRHIEQRGIED